MTESRPEASTCPLCGADNHCAIAAAQAPESCWCHSVVIDAAAREKAAGAAPQRCLCPDCGGVTGSLPE